MFPSKTLVLTLAGRLDIGMPWFKTTIVLFLFVEKLLEERQEDAAGLKFKCNRAGTMSDEETAELRNEIKVFRNILYTYILSWINHQPIWFQSSHSPKIKLVCLFCSISWVNEG